MKKFLNKILFGAMGLNILYLIFGVALLFFPNTSLDVIRVVFSLLMLITSIYQLIMYIMKTSKKGLFYLNLYFSILGIITSLFLLFRPIVITNMIVLFLGIWFIVQGIYKFLYGFRLAKIKEEISPLIIVSGVCMFLSGCLVLIYPKLIFSNITRGVGLFIILYAVVDSINYFLLFKRSKQILKLFK